jgi:hypothetical protein
MRSMVSTHRVTKFCLTTLADHSVNDFTAMTVNQETTAEQNEKGWNGLGLWCVN